MNAKTEWLAAWRRRRCGLRSIGPLAPLASYCYAVREHSGARLSKVQDYRHRRTLGQSPARALAGAAKHAPKVFHRRSM